MKNPLIIPHASFESSGERFRILQKSPGFVEEGWDEFLRKLGPIPSETSFERVVFVYPYDDTFIGIARLGTNPTSGTVFLVHRTFYEFVPHPFYILDQFPNPRDGEDEEWVPATKSLPPRRVEDLQAVLRDGDGPLLLGTTQGLVDTEQILLVATEPREKFLRDLWQLLPDSTRRVTWVASYCFAELPEFHLSFVPKLPEQLGRYMDEERVLDYPDSRYERSLQIAIEAGDQRELDSLLARRSTTETIRLMVMILILMAVVSVASRFIG